jgi:two-component system, cell cycle sensor histidine kinase and response regulator CckA
MKKILVVDNHPIMLKFMSQLLEKKGHQVWTAPDGLSALEILKTDIPDIIFADLIMPNIDGKKLCRIIRSTPNLKDIFVVIVSAIATEEEPHLADYGADVCIAKGPFNKMAEHVLTAIDHSYLESTQRPKVKIIGLEKLFKREITKELLASRKHFEATLNNISEGIMELTSEFRIVYINPAALSIVGIPEENTLSKNFTELFNGNHRERIIDALKNSGNKKQLIGSEAPVELNNKQITLNFIPINDDGQHPILVILKDVTKRKKMEAQLQHAQRMEAIGTLAAGVAHEINNPISGIMGYAEILKERYHEQDRKEDIPGKIIKESDRIAEIVKNLLSFAKDWQDESSSARIKDILSNTLGMIKGRMAKDGIKLSVEVSKSLPDIKARCHEIQQVFLNILSNAHYSLNQRFPGYHENKFLNVQGKTVRLENRNYVRTTFYDHGTGIPKNILNKVCDPFFSTKPPGSGTGLGLSISHSIIQNHGGKLLFESVEGEYTKVMVDLPTIG